MNNTLTYLSRLYRQLPVRWSLIALFAIPITYLNGLWLTALQGAIGAVERSETPFFRWLRDSTLMLPLVALSILLALLWARRLLGGQYSLGRFWGVAIVLALVTATVGIAEASMSSLIDYRYQVQHVELMHSVGAPQQAADSAAGFGSASYYLYCNIRGTLIGSSATVQQAGSLITQLEYATFIVHVRALVLYAVLLLLSNLILSVIILAFCSNALWKPALLSGATAQPSIRTTAHHSA